MVASDQVQDIADQLGCRVADGIAERVIFRSLFTSGLTVFDQEAVDLTGGAPSTSHISALQEYRSLLGALHLPIRGKIEARRAA